MQDGCRGPRRPSAKIFFISAVLFLLAAARCQGETLGAIACKNGADYGYVIGVRGKWVDLNYPRNGNRPLQPFNKLCADSELAHSGAIDPDDRIALRSNERGQTYSCATPTQCEKSFPLPPLPSHQSGFFATVLHLLDKQEPPRAVSLSRGSGLTDSVLPIQAGTVRLDGVFQYTDHGDYKLLLCAVDLDQTSGCTGRQMEQHLVLNGSEGPVLVTGLSPGIYQLTLLDWTRNDQSDPEGWILVCNQRDWAAVDRKFRAALEESSSWGASAPDRAPLLRLYLISLAKGLSR